MELEPFTCINRHLQGTIKKIWNCNPKPREEMGPVHCFLRQPIIFSDCRVAAGGCHKMCRIALLCRHCSALTFVSSQSVILQVNLVCKCFLSSAARCICHIDCITSVPSLKIQSFYFRWYFFLEVTDEKIHPFQLTVEKLKATLQILKAGIDNINPRFSCFPYYFVSSICSQHWSTCTFASLELFSLVTQVGPAMATRADFIIWAQ